MKEITIKTEKATVIVSSDVDVKVRGNEIILKLIDVIQQKEINQVEDLQAENENFPPNISTTTDETPNKHTKRKRSREDTDKVCRGGGIGIHSRLKTCRSNELAGSSPALGTIKNSRVLIREVMTTNNYLLL